MQNDTISNEIKQQEEFLKECRRLVALGTRYGTSERPIDLLRQLYEADELTREHMMFVKRIDVFDTEHFKIQLQDESPLAVICKNMNLYEEE